MISHRFIFTFIGGIFTINYNFLGFSSLIYEVINQVTEANKKETENHGSFSGLEKAKLGFLFHVQSSTGTPKIPKQIDYIEPYIDPGWLTSSAILNR